jgi:hypothetical protein
LWNEACLDLAGHELIHRGDVRWEENMKEEVKFMAGKAELPEIRGVMPMEER